MKEAYIRSLQMIYMSEKRLTKKQYTKIAKEYTLLSIPSLQYISHCSFQYLVRKALIGII